MPVPTTRRTLQSDKTSDIHLDYMLHEHVYNAHNLLYLECFPYVIGIDTDVTMANLAHIGVLFYIVEYRKLVQKLCSSI